MGWRKGILLLVLILLAPSIRAEVNYLFEVAENGETFVTIDLDQKTSITFPPDADSPEIEEGTLEYVNENTAIADTNTTATIRYASSYHTRKEKGVWHFEALTKADNIELILPQAVHVVQTTPKATLVKEETWQLTWENANNISASYVQVNQAELTPIQKPQKFQTEIILLIVILAITAAYYVYTSNKKITHTTKPNISEGQLNIIRAANQNEATVIKIILQNNGHVKRNALERESQLSKSSLASVLKNLEKKNIITIDRTFFVHHIALTNWFKELK